MAHGLTIAAKEELPWLIVQRGTQIRLYPASPDVGVGRKGQGETYAELDLAILPGAEAAYLSLLFAPDALRRGGTVEEILKSSENFAADLGQRLRTRVYEKVVPALAVAVADKMNARTEDELAEAYHRNLVILFRLLFLAYAEDRRLLPYERNSRYDRLEAPYAPRIQRAVREIVTDDSLIGHQKAGQLLALADQLGLAVQPVPEPLPSIHPDDIHLVCWTLILPELSEA